MTEKTEDIMRLWASLSNNEQEKARQKIAYLFGDDWFSGFDMNDPDDREVMAGSLHVVLEIIIPKIIEDRKELSDGAF